MGWKELLFRQRNADTRVMVGFPNSGGLISGGVSATTTLGLSAVWRCIDILSNGVSQLEWRERRGTLDLPLSRIVMRPQAQRTRREWTSLVVSTLALFDVCYLYKAGGVDAEGVPIGLWYIDPTLVSPASMDLFTSAFLLPPSEFFIGGVRTSADDLVVLHRSPQPTISDTAGGILNLARTTFAAAIAAEQYASRYWQAGGPPTTVLETDQRLTQAQADETQDRWYQKRSLGPDYAPVLGGGLKAKSFGADPTSESAVEARRELVADIGRYFGIPTRILNAPTGDSETYTSTTAANQDLVRYTLQNYIGAIEDGISELLPGGRRMEMDPWKLTSGTQYEQAQTYQLATGNKPWMTAEDVRERLRLPPVENPADLMPPRLTPAGANE
jgi:phage portal protein BeeE